MSATSAPEADIHLDTVSKRFGDMTAVDELTLSIERGAFYAMLGPSGCGKTTTLRMIGGFEDPTSGRVYLGGDEVTEQPPYKRDVNTVFQSYALFPHLNVEKNVGFGLERKKTSKDEVRKRVGEALELVQLGHLGKRKPGQLSGGQQQRVALARALAAGPDLLLLDEPLAALDVDTMPAMRALLRRTIRDSGRTAVLVTHTALDALVLADRVAVLSDGVVAEEGATREVLARPRSPFAARIAGLDLVPGLACPEGLKTADGFVITGQAEGTVTGEPAVAVFPPAAVAVFAQHPHGSPRNVVQVRLAAVEPHGDLVRLRAGVRDGGPAWADGLAADVTPAALVDLPAEPGVLLWFAVKAAEVVVHPAGRAP